MPTIFTRIIEGECPVGSSGATTSAPVLSINPLHPGTRWSFRPEVDHWIELPRR